ncbi:MAG: type II secretion system F family protein [Verrucomicrobiae bacterium]|nr:type II secretion system F family protein [Verrucomicrobiae bacterium]
MPRFEYQAKDRAGAAQDGVIEASDLAQAHRLLQARQCFVVRIKEEGTASKPVSSVRQRGAPQARRPRRKQLPMKTEQMAELLRAGMRLSEVLETMARRTADPGWGGVFEDLRSAVVGGKPLSIAMETHSELFDGFFRSMVATGEASGHLAEVLERLAAYLQRQEMLRQQVVAALIYPGIIIAAGISTVAFFMMVMLPRLAAMFREMGQALPWSTRLLIWFSDMATSYGWVGILLAVAGWFAFRKWVREPANKLAWDGRVLRLPLAGRLVALSEHSRFSQTLSTLLQSGITLVEALRVAEATIGNEVLRQAIRVVRGQVQEGKSLRDALAAQGVFPALMLDMLGVGERTGDLGGSLRYIAQAYERDMERSTKTLTSLIEPVLIVLMAAFVGSIVFSVLVAVFDLTSGIGRL